jgi:hypothetical protein
MDIPIGTAKRNLEYQFGIMPIVNDLIKMLKFQELTDKRFRALKDLSKGSSVRHATVYQDTSVEPWSGSTFLTGLYQETTKIRWRMQTDRRIWVSTRWNTDAPLPDSDQELQRLANQLVVGSNISFATLWNAMPWSWLVDWFSNTGDIIQGWENTIPVNHTGSCIMRHTRKQVNAWEWTVEPSGGRQTLAPIPNLRETKFRSAAPSFVLPEFYLPGLTGGQLSILSALTVVKGG